MDERTLADLSLHELLIGAAEAPPNYRIQFRDPIAAHGAAAAKALADWLMDASLAGFAVRTIGRSADVDRDAAVGVLRQALTLDLVRFIREDVIAELARLGVKPGPQPRARKAHGDPIAGLQALARGQVYRRGVHLHAAGLGGNVQKGISYPAGGSYVLLFSDPASITVWGYNDRWDGTDAYWYYGEWDGSGDMALTKGNLRVVERSPELHLFVAAPGGHRYEGRFRYHSHHQEVAKRDGVTANAIVFRLVREPGST